MMDSWRRQGGDYRNQRSQYRKPPLGNWQPTVPAWEKKFCAVVGLISWQKLLARKKFIHLYENVLKWNDSAGEEAFNNAKNRFWAEFNDLPCNISAPGPDIYIDLVDWNAEIDPKLLSDLENDSTVPSNEQVVIFGEPIGSTHMHFSTGWGDFFNDSKNNDSSPENKGNQGESGWEDIRNDSGGGKQETEAGKVNGWENKGNGWDDDGQIGWEDKGNPCESGWEDVRQNGWDEGWNNPWNQFGNNTCKSNYWKDQQNSGVWEPGDANNRNWEDNGRYKSRYKTSRFHSNDQWTNQDHHGKGRRTSRQWNLMNSCAPVSHHRAAKQGNRWNWEKPVS